MTETANVNYTVREEYASYGRMRGPYEVAESFGDDTIKMIQIPQLDPDCIRLQARCAIRFARLALGEV